MVRPRGALVIPRGNSALVRFDHEHAARVSAAKKALALAEDADANAAAPITFGTREWA